MGLGLGGLKGFRGSGFPGLGVIGVGGFCRILLLEFLYRITVRGWYLTGLFMGSYQGFLGFRLGVIVFKAEGYVVLGWGQWGLWSLDSRDGV